MKNKLSNIIQIATENVPFYQKIACSTKMNTLEDFPFITRENLSMHKGEFINDKYTPYDLKNMICLRTSGTSTGYPLEIYWSREDYIRSSYWTWKYRQKWYGISPQDRYVCFHTYIYTNNRVEKDKTYFTNQQYLSLCLNKINEQNMDQFCRKIFEYQPVWIQFLPSIAIKFVDYMQRNNISSFPSLKYIEYNGEPLKQSLRDEVDNFFQVPSSNLYGCMEVNAIGFECPHGNMQIVSENVILETFSGKAYVTSLNNTVMPLIRYELGDEVDIGLNSCHCTNDSRIITKVNGRTYNVIDINGTRVSECLAGYCIDIINGNMCNCIKQFQFFKVGETWKLVLYIHPKFNGWKYNIALQTINTLALNNIRFKDSDIIFVNQPIENIQKKATVFEK